MRRMNWIGALAGSVALAGVASGAWAVPSLQLDIAGGVYDAGTQTILSRGDVFTLYAYLIPDVNQNNPLLSNAVGDTYYISAALTPKTQPTSGTTYGSFQFDSTTIDVPSHMTHGTPPVDSTYPDLGSHGIYDTYYKAFSFQFNTANNSAIQNTQDSPGTGPVAGTGMYFAAFSVNVAGLAVGYDVHFDLYNQNLETWLRENRQGIRTGTNYETLFAPFSHDAQSGPSHPVPEPATMMLLGSGLLGLGCFARRKVREG